MIVVSFYTPDYREHADRLRQSCQRFRLRYWIEPLEDAGEWVVNCSRKAGFVTKALMATDDDVLWLDADAEVRRPLTHLQQMLEGYDAAFFRAESPSRKLRLRSGTAYFAQTAAGVGLALSWFQQASAKPHVWDQETLLDAIEGFRQKTKVLRLPMSYCQRFDESDGVDDPHIVHYQASRELKRKLYVARG